MNIINNIFLIIRNIHNVSAGIHTHLCVKFTTRNYTYVQYLDLLTKTPCMSCIHAHYTGNMIKGRGTTCVLYLHKDRWYKSCHQVVPRWTREAQVSST